MPPGTRRAGRGNYAEHDDFEGLPVRQWRLEAVTVEPPRKQEHSQKNDIWDVDLPYGMPKDSHLLPSHSLELLRAARSGRLYKRPPPPEEEEADADANLPENKEKKEEDTSSGGFSIKVWKQLPRNVEAPTISHLAKRRKGTVTIASKTPEDKIAGPTVTRATVRRVDAAGNPYTEEVTLGGHQQVVGEIIATRVEVVPAAVASSLNAPPPAVRRRPPIPKRKFKPGPGRGRKKTKLPLAPGGQAAGPIPTGANAAAQTADGASAAHQGNDTSTPNPDSEMADGDDQDDNDENDDNDDDEGEEGEEGDDTERLESDQPEGTTAPTEGNQDQNQSQSQDHVMEDAPPPATTSVTPDLEMKDEPSLEASAVPNPLSSIPPFGGVTKERLRVEGSPLKNVSVASPPPQHLEPQPQITSEMPEEDRKESILETTAEALAEQAIVEPVIPTADISGSVTLAEVVENRNASESVVAEPPSTIVGEAPEEAIERDVPMKPTIKLTEDPSASSLLPPPPEQVGNIATPLTEAEPKDFATDDSELIKDDIQPGEESVPLRPPISTFNSSMTEDSIKPDDSASVSFPIDPPTAEEPVGDAIPLEESSQNDADSVAAVIEEPVVADIPEEAPEPLVSPPKEDPPALAAAPAEIAIGGGGSADTPDPANEVVDTLGGQEDPVPLVTENVKHESSELIDEVNQPAPETLEKSPAAIKEEAPAEPLSEIVEAPKEEELADTNIGQEPQTAPLEETKAEEEEESTSDVKMAEADQQMVSHEETPEQKPTISEQGIQEEASSAPDEKNLDQAPLSSVVDEPEEKDLASPHAMEIDEGTTASGNEKDAAAPQE